METVLALLALLTVWVLAIYLIAGPPLVQIAATLGEW